MSPAPRRILIVEDQRIVAADIERAVKSRGYDVAGIATSAEEAIQKASTLGADLVLMDIRLRGERDGIWAARIIRERFDRPVVFLTAYADEQTISRATTTAPFGYIVKPFNEQELHAVIEMALNKHEADRESLGVRVRLAEDETRRRTSVEEQRRFRSLLESVRDYAVLMLDPHGRILTWNRGAEAIKGYRSEEIVGQRFCRFYPEEDIVAGKPERELKLAAEVGRTEDEGWRVRKDGSRFWGNVVITPIFDRPGHLEGFATVTRDLTERRRAEEALDRERKLLASVTQATDVMLVYLDPAFNFVWVNAAYAATCRMRPEELIGKNHFALYPHVENEAIFRRVLETGEPVFYKDKPFEFTDQPERGITYWNWSLVPVKRDSAVQGLVFSLRETTKYKRAELALQEAQQKYEVIHDKAPFAIALTKIPEGTFATVNDVFLKLFEFTREEVVGKTSLALGISDPDSLALVGEQLQRHGSVRDLEVIRRTKSGSQLVLSLNLDRVNVGREQFVLTAFQDITERKRAEEALREASRRKDEFIGMLSHELRNPLAPIRNAAYILRHAGAATDQANRAREIIERQTEHLTRLVGDLLDATRIARGMIELRRARVDLREVVVAACEDFRLVMRDRGVPFDVVVPDEPVWAEVDATRIMQVVGNLVHNASKYTRPGDSVCLSLAAVGGMAEARVRDTGVGIDASLLPSVFDPFVQGDRTLARTEGGLGLGLAVVKGITELHGGKVTAASAGTGQGSEFVVRLPLSSAVGFQDRALDVTGPSGDARRVLVVDDNADAAESLGEIVKLLGHTVELAYDGPSALEKARATPPDVVLCDIGLPGMAGYDVAKRLRAAGHDGIQLIAVSGYAQPEDVERAIEAGFDRHVAKPVNAAVIERLLKR